MPTLDITHRAVIGRMRIGNRIVAVFQVRGQARSLLCTNATPEDIGREMDIVITSSMTCEVRRE